MICIPITTKTLIMIVEHAGYVMDLEFARMLIQELMLRISAALLFAGQATALAEEFVALMMTAWSIIAELLASGVLILMLLARTLIISRTLAALIVVKASARLVTGGFAGLLIVAQTLAMTA